MEKKLQIPIILGTNRKGRQSEHVANFLLEQINKYEEIEPKLFDTKDFDFPTDDYGQDIKDRFPEYRDAVIKADGLIIIAPEYNHGYPGILKSVLDLVLKEYAHKAVGLVGVSMQPWGATRVTEQLVNVVRELGLQVTFTDLNFPQVQNSFDEKGKIRDGQAYSRRTDRFLAELIWMSKTLRWGRENVLG